MTTDKKISKITEKLQLKIPDIVVKKMEVVEKCTLPLNNNIYKQIVKQLTSKIEEYKTERVIIISYKQIKYLLQNILTSGNFINVKLNKTYQHIIFQKSIEHCFFVRYKENIIYLKI